jgi:hypothetical protein
MTDQDLIMTAARSRRRGALRSAILLAVGCSLLATPASSQSITDRFKSLFGSSSEPAQSDSPPPAPTSTEAGSDLTCPSVSVRAGASTYAVGLPGKPAAGNDLRYQATIGRTARDCTVNGGMITARIGIQGRVIAGPAGAPSSVDVPLRVAVVQEGVSPKTIFTKAWSTRCRPAPPATPTCSISASIRRR